jgi:hypothetical protein
MLQYQGMTCFIPSNTVPLDQTPLCAKIRVADLMMVESDGSPLPPAVTLCGCSLPQCIARTENGTCLVFAAKMVAAGDTHVCPGAVKDGATALMAALNMNKAEAGALAVSLGLPKPERHWSDLQGAEEVQAVMKNMFI